MATAVAAEHRVCSCVIWIKSKWKYSTLLWRIAYFQRKQGNKGEEEEWNREETNQHETKTVLVC